MPSVGDNQWAWLTPGSLLAFEPYYEEYRKQHGGKVRRADVVD